MITDLGRVEQATQVRPSESVLSTPALCGSRGREVALTAMWMLDGRVAS